VTVAAATQVRVEVVGPDAAREVLDVIHAAFGDRPDLEPPATAMEETLDSVAAALADGGGLLATLDGVPVGALLIEVAGPSMLLKRVSVLPDRQSLGIAQALSAAADEVARSRGLRRLHLTARAELPATVRFWLRGGYREVARVGPTLTLAKELPVDCVVPTAEAMRRLGERLASVLRPGDVVILSGELGAGKTTFTQGLGAGLGVRGDITSPTFVISRIHPSLRGGPPLVHVDAYRLGPASGHEQATAELDDLDLDVTVEESVTVVEWGEGLAEALADDRLEVRIARSTGGPAGEQDGEPEEGAEGRTVRLTPVGVRWVGSELATVVA
jgi:tRNA threonylcarbamoyladenosine biosynthesis protein TsaE